MTAAACKRHMSRVWHPCCQSTSRRRAFSRAEPIRGSVEAKLISLFCCGESADQITSPQRPYLIVRGVENALQPFVLLSSWIGRNGSASPRVYGPSFFVGAGPFSPHSVGSSIATPGGGNLSTALCRSRILQAHGSVAEILASASRSQNVSGAVAERPARGWNSDRAKAPVISTS